MCLHRYISCRVLIHSSYILFQRVRGSSTWCGAASYQLPSHYEKRWERSNGAKLLVLFNEGKSRTLLLSRCRLLSSSGVISFGIRVVELVVRRFEKCRATNYRYNVIRIGAMERSKALVYFNLSLGSTFAPSSTTVAFTATF